jgi:ubiquinone/menaquinone biosynthesis C-methylase UbiE
MVLQTLAARGGETIVDLGAGTGSLAILIKRNAPQARVVAIDPDPAVRQIGEAKARTAGVNIEFITAMGDEAIAAVPAGSVDAVTCSLVLHQCPLEMKRAIIANAARLLRPKGRLVLADYGAQPNLLMRLGFLLVQTLDGFEATEHNRRGVIPQLIDAAGFTANETVGLVATPTGAITVWRAQPRVSA